MENKRTPLYEDHLAVGAKMIAFAGWEMPVQYEGIKTEHLHVRSQVGIFDVSHMGEIRFLGPQALSSLEWMTTNFVGKLKKGQAQYSLIPNAEGGVVDDIIIYCIEPNSEYLVCVNAANIEKDYQHFLKNNKGAEIKNESSSWGQIALQGPRAFEVLGKIFSNNVKNIKPFHFEFFEFEGKQAMVARTGYTGEEGVEIFIPADKVSTLWKTLLKEEIVKPIGLGARDTLRLEMKYPLYGHELSDNTNPYEAGLGWVVKPMDKDFLGSKIIVDRKEQGLNRKMIGLEVLGRGIPREGYKVFSFDNKELGEVTSGTMSPSLNKAIGIAYVQKKYAEIGAEVKVEIHNKLVDAKVVETPFVKR